MAIFYCSSSGSSGDGSLGNPWGITEAVFSAAGVDDGDTLLFIVDGTYAGKLTVGGKGTASEPILLDQQNALHDVASGESQCVVLSGGREYYLLRNFRVRRATGGNIVLQSSTAGGGTTGCTVKHTVSDNAGGNGVAHVLNSGANPATPIVTGKP